MYFTHRVNSRYSFRPGSEQFPSEGEPYASRIHVVGRSADGSEIVDFGLDIAFVVLHESRMLSNPSTPALTPTDLDVDDVPASRTAYGCVGFPGSVNVSHNGQFDATSYFYGGTPADTQVYKLLGYQLATHFIMNFDHANMIDPKGSQIAVPEANGMSGGPVFRLGTFDDILAGHAAPRVVATTIEWYPNRRVLVAIRMSLVVTAIAQLVPALAPVLPTPTYVEMRVTSP